MNNLTSLLALTTAQPGTTTPLDVRGVAAAQNDLQHLQAHVLNFLHAAVHHQEPLDVVEGAMLLLEQLSLKETTSTSDLISAGEDMQTIGELSVWCALRSMLMRNGLRCDMKTHGNSRPVVS